MEKYFHQLFPIVASNKLESEESVELPCGVFTELPDYSKHFPFLNDEKTVEFIQKSQVMFINRGLPGSGKSTLSKKIAETYDQTIICSGDDYFIDENGNYKFDANKLHEAHASAKVKAENACKESKSPIIADNTNVKYWELKSYSQIAKKFDYITIVVEPRTSFKFDPEFLAVNNKHNVPQKAIVQKLHDFQTILPYYFAWFFNWTDSNNLIDMAKDLLDDCTSRLPQFKTDLVAKNKCSLESIFQFYKTIVHCTTKFCGSNRHHSPEDVQNYVKQTIVSSSNGKASEIKVVGFSMSNNTISAAVELSREQHFLWKNNLSSEELNEIFLEKFFAGKNRSDLMGKLEYGVNAHITLALGPDAKARKAGVDLFNNNLRLETLNNSPELKNSLKLSDYEIFYLNECYCYVKLNKPLYFTGVFTGEY